MVFEIPYEFLERVFGSFVAQNFNTITTILFLGGLVFVLLGGKSYRNRRSSTREARQTQTIEPEQEKAYPAFNKNKWNTNGWIFNEETKLWEPPDYLAEQSKDKWRWDKEKRIWIDREKEARLERYHEFRKSQGKGQTYEEWKAAREAEQKDKSTN